jgi:hypothetical protein
MEHMLVRHRKQGLANPVAYIGKAHRLIPFLEVACTAEIKGDRRHTA